MKKIIFSIIIMILAASLSYANTLYTTGPNHIASVSYNYYKQAVRVVADGDKKAFDTMISEKKIFILKEGLSVYVVERKFPGTIKIRVKGTTSEAWTAKEAIKRQIVLPLAFGAKPYAYRTIGTRDVSYKDNDRMVYEIYLETDTLPDEERMKATARQIWENGNLKWDQFTVFMIFGEIKDFNSGAYGVCEFTTFGMTKFFINDVPLQMLKLKTKTD